MNAWQKTAENCANYLKKGRLVAVYQSPVLRLRKKEIKMELTADKILKLEEVLLQSKFSIKVNYYGDSLYAYEGCEGFYASREEALASLLVKLYDRFSEDERQQIKEVLEG